MEIILIVIGVVLIGYAIFGDNLLYKSKFKSFSEEKQIQVVLLGVSIAQEICRQETGSHPTGSQAFIKGAKIGATLESWKKGSSIDSMTKEAIRTGNMYQAANFIQGMGQEWNSMKLSSDLANSPETIAKDYIAGKRFSGYLTLGMKKAIKMADKF